MNSNEVFTQKENNESDYDNLNLSNLSELSLSDDEKKEKINSLQIEISIIKNNHNKKIKDEADLIFGNYSDEEENNKNKNKKEFIHKRMSSNLEYMLNQRKWKETYKIRRKIVKRIKKKK